MAEHIDTVAANGSPAGWRWLGPAAALAVYVWLLAPSVAWFDSGELAASAVQLGVPHPTGFAAFVLAGHTAARMPLADAALRVHLLGAICGVLAVVTWRRALGRPWPSGWRTALNETAACLLPLGIGALAMHLRATEVYPPTWLVVAVAVWVWRYGGERRAAMLAALTGIGLAVHVEAALLCAPMALAAWCLRPRRWWQVTAWGLAGALPLLALPLLALRAPYLSWGDVRTGPALLAHLSGMSIREAYAARIGGSLADLEALARLAATQAGWHLLLAAVLGGVALARDAQRRSVLAPTVWVVLGDALYALTVNPMGLRDQQAGLLLLLGASVLAGIAVEHAVASAPRWAWLAPLLLAAWTGHGMAAQAEGQADLRAGSRYADRLLENAAPGGVLVATADHTAAACQWLQGASGVRPDVACVPGAFLRDDRMVRQQAEATGHSALLSAAGKSGAERSWSWLRAAAAPVGWQPGLAAEDQAVRAHVRAGWPWSALAAEVSATTAMDAARALPSLMTAACQSDTGDPMCHTAPTWAGLLSVELSVHAAQWAGRDRGLARQLAEHAVALAPTPKALHNLAVLLVDDDPQRALALAELAVDRQPDHLRAHRAAARAAVHLGAREKAMAHASAAVAEMTAAEATAWLTSLARSAPPAWREELRRLAPAHEPTR